MSKNCYLLVQLTFFRSMSLSSLTLNCNKLLPKLLNCSKISADECLIKLDSITDWN